MTDKEPKAYGTWPSPITPETITADVRRATVTLPQLIDPSDRTLRSMMLLLTP